MPQGRKKVPFSGKAKKEQLKIKKQTRAAHASTSKKTILIHRSDSDESSQAEVQKVNEQPSRFGRSNRYALKFYKETAEEVKQQKEYATNEIVPISSQKELEVSEDYFLKEYDFPVRPKWSYGISKQELDAVENRYFTEYISKLEENCDWKSMSYFELNLETWRQLWRVLEMSDIVLFIVDIRFAGIMFPPSLYRYVTNELHKDIILVLNKIDLSPPELVVGWRNYFQEKYPQLHIIMFTTLPGYNIRGNTTNATGLLNRRRKGRLRMAAEGTQMLLDVCKTIVKDKVDLSSWQNKIKEESSSEYEEDTPIVVGSTILDTNDTSFFQHELYKNNVLTIGCIGQPNVGKSSLMNAVMGRKVVSVSKTPGHTKHFQTIFLTENVRLCDCPGLVFPSGVPKPLQVLSGSYPIAQLRDPYTTIRYVAERIDLPRLLNVAHPTGDDTWSALDICDGWAKKRGFYTAKAARLDTFRAANNLLRMCLDGKICLRLYPPGYIDKRDELLKHTFIKTVQWIQALTDEQKQVAINEMDSSESESNDGNESSSESSEDVSTDAQINKFSVLSVDE